MSPTDPKRILAHAALVLGVALAYVACASLGLTLAVHADEVSAVWPPTGFALAAVVLFGRRAVAGVFAGAVIANFGVGEPLWVAAGVGAGNTLEAVVGAALLSRLKFDAALARVRDVLSLFVAVAVAPCVSATIGVGFLVAGGLHKANAIVELWPVWWLGDALGALIIAPLILVWARGRQNLRVYGALEPALMLATTVLVAGSVFTLPPLPIAYFVYPVLIWAGLRLGPAYTTTASLLVNAIAIVGTLSSHGPFAAFDVGRGLVLVQVFIALAASTALLLGAVAAESRNAHGRAEVSEQRLRLAMAGARVGVWEWNVTTGDITWSEGLEPLHGLPAGGFAGDYQAWRKMIHPDDVEDVEARIRTSVETRQPYDAEFRLVGSDGVVRWTAARGVVLSDAKGRPARMVGVGIDVTQQKQLEAELRQQHRRKDEFLAMLAHELRNPLAAIVHAVDLLTPPEHMDAEEARRVIERQTRVLMRLVDDLLDVSRITRGQITLERKRISLSDVLAEAAGVWRHMAAQRRQTLTLDRGDDTLWVDGDSMRLTQVFANIVHNAVKFTADGGHISVTSTEEEGQAVVRVRDDGRGMTADVLEHAFDLFVQGAPAIDRQHGGLGLGLTLVRRLVEMQGGSVEARSDGVGHGTEMVVRLPLAARTAAQPALAEAGRIPATVRRRVLVVEDNDDARIMLVRLVRHAGHEVRSANDGRTALTEARSFVPEVVLLDIGLPGLDGYAVARELRASPGTAEALLIALTGYGQAEDREKAFAAGFDQHLLKPAEPARILEAVNGSRIRETAV